MPYKKGKVMEYKNTTKKKKKKKKNMKELDMQILKEEDITD